MNAPGRPARPQALWPEDIHPLRRGVWWLWCALTRTLRPALFLALVFAALFCAARAALVFEAETGWAPHHATLERRIAEAWAHAPGANEDARGFWAGALAHALDPANAPRPDIALARSYAGALDALVGRDALAMEVLGRERDRARLEADLRARPAWQRARRLEHALSAHLERAREDGLDPPELIFAPERERERFARASQLYGRTLAGAEAWMSDPAERQLRLDALPGWNAAEPGALLHGDIRALVVAGCAMARENRLPIEACASRDIPAAAPDPAGLTLALLAAGLAQDSVRSGEGPAGGARILRAAHEAGWLRPGLLYVAAGQRSSGHSERVLASLVPLLHEAEAAYDQPWRYRAMAGAAAREAFIYRRARTLAGLAGQAADLRREVGALDAIRLLAAAGGVDQLEALNAIADITGPDTLALFHAYRGGEERLFALVEDRRLDAPLAMRWLAVGLGFLVLAGLLLVSAYTGALADAVTGRPGLVRSLAWRAEGLILGKKV